MDWTQIVVALLALVGTSIGTVAGIRKSTSLVEYRLTKLEEKINKHNEVITRTYKLEQDYAVMEEKIKVANNRINDLEETAEEYKRKG